LPRSCYAMTFTRTDGTTIQYDGSSTVREDFHMHRAWSWNEALAQRSPRSANPVPMSWTSSEPNVPIQEFNPSRARYSYSLTFHLTPWLERYTMRQRAMRFSTLKLHRLPENRLSVNKVLSCCYFLPLAFDTALPPEGKRINQWSRGVYRSLLLWPWTYRLA
jgi:hypothetical protein